MGFIVEKINLGRLATRGIFKCFFFVYFFSASSTSKRDIQNVAFTSLHTRCSVSSVSVDRLVGVGDVEEAVLVLVLLVELPDVGGGGGDVVVDEEEERRLGFQSDPVAHHREQLGHLHISAERKKEGRNSILRYSLVAASFM